MCVPLCSRVTVLECVLGLEGLIGSLLFCVCAHPGVVARARYVHAHTCVLTRGVCVACTHIHTHVF
jgi:hypothetical protein